MSTKGPAALAKVSSAAHLLTSWRIPEADVPTSNGFKGRKSTQRTNRDACERGQLCVGPLSIGKEGNGGENRETRNGIFKKEMFHRAAGRGKYQWIPERGSKLRAVINQTFQD